MIPTRGDSFPPLHGCMHCRRGLVDAPCTVGRTSGTACIRELGPTARTHCARAQRGHAQDPSLRRQRLRRRCCPPTRAIRAASLTGSTTLHQAHASTIPSRGRLHQAHASCRRAGDCRFAGWSPPVGWAPHPWMTWAAAVAVSLAERRKTMAPAVALASPWTVALGQGRFRRPPRRSS